MNMKVVQLRDTTLRDSPAMLRKLANAIESGEYGEVDCIGVVLIGDAFHAFGYGDGIKNESVGPSVATLFRAGALRIEMEIEKHGRQ